MKKILSVICLLAVISLANNASAQNNNNQPKPDSATQIKAYLTSIHIFSEALKNKNQSKNSLASLYLLRGTTESKVKQFAKAISDCTSAISLNSEFVDAYLARGMIYEQINENELAAKDYRKVLPYVKNNKDNSAVLYDKLASVERNIRHYDKAIEADSMAIVLIPQFGGAYAGRGRSYGLMGKYQLAINDLSMAMYGYQDNNLFLSVLFAERGDMKRALKQYKDAINDYSFAIKLDPNNKIAYWNRAASYNMNGDYQLANDDYSKALLYFQGDSTQLSRLHYDRARMEIGLQQFKSAIDDDSLAISLDTGYKAAYWNRADAHSQNGDYLQSNADYKKTIYYYKNNKKAVAELYNSMANNEYLLNQFQQVIDDCTSAISLNPQNWSPYLNRGRAYLKKMDKELAMSDFKKIIEMDTARKSDDYAFALYYTGDSNKAILVMQDNLVSTTNPYFLLIEYYNMACLYSLMNKPDESNTFLKKCIDGGYPKRYALTDTDLDNIRNTDEFKSMMGSSVK